MRHHLLAKSAVAGHGSPRASFQFWPACSAHRSGIRREHSCHGTCHVSRGLSLYLEEKRLRNKSQNSRFMFAQPSPDRIASDPMPSGAVTAATGNLRAVVDSYALASRCQPPPLSPVLIFHPKARERARCPRTAPAIHLRSNSTVGQSEDLERSPLMAKIPTVRLPPPILKVTLWMVIGCKIRDVRSISVW